ncbi:MULTISPECIES: hypothetical protein [unclassified Marinimicrobium]|uniref:hypothetical protein n=1 Tax=Marinimicrobium TaxID=359337 RepID=UPI000C636277|nr:MULTISPECIES: hypothetical protein [unclassified Marinimicrobium]MAN50653.1 hypothetical protein [Marinimicrobium sp.]|tara:strand:- start:280 stop:831 length:552 start_codon:yes stop_codon:yes gene_type:complete
MKPLSLLALVCLGAISAAVSADERPAQIYLNENLGFNIEGYNYAQDELPCEIEQSLVSSILERAEKQGLVMQAVSTADKIKAGDIPVLAIDIEGLTLGSEEFTFGMKSNSKLPAVKVTTALIHATAPNSVVTASHSCGFASLRDFTPSSNVLDMGTAYTVCSATQRCLKDLSKDIVEWLVPLL